MIGNVSKIPMVARATLMEAMHHISMISARAADLAAMNERLTTERDDLAARNADLEKELADLKPAKVQKVKPAAGAIGQGVVAADTVVKP